MVINCSCIDSLIFGKLRHGEKETQRIASKGLTMLRTLALWLLLVSISVAAQERDLATDKDALKRVALVIGNAAYKRSEDRLINPGNDARAIAAKLRGLDIEVIEAIDLDYRGMRAALRQFDRALKGADAGLFFYAGHGMEYRGRNYLFPTDIVLETEGDVGLGLIDVAQVLQVMETTVPTRLIFLDACRNNPLARRFRNSLGATRASTVGTGLARMDAGIGTFIAYATAPGQLAEDGQGENSPFSAAMIQHLDTPGLDVSQLMRRIRNTVLEATDERQVPWESSSLRSPFVLNRTPAAPAPQVLAPSPSIDKRRTETLFWQSIESSERIAAFEAYLDRFGEDGVFAPLAKLRIEDLRAPSRAESALAFDRREVQQALKSLGYNVGTPHDEFGPQMRMAIRLWQATHQIDPNGYLTIDQIDDIMKEAGEQQIAQAPVVRQEPEPFVRDELAPAPAAPEQSLGKQKIESGPQTLLTPFRDCQTCPEMIVIPAGSFMMGSPADLKGRPENELPQHEVTISQPFAIGKFEVTFAEWDACVAAGACRHRPDDRGWGRGSMPVMRVNSSDIEEFLGWLSRSTGTSFRLPSEAEWEYAARGSTTTRFWWGDEVGGNRANCGWLCEDKWLNTAPIGSFGPNGFGLFDTAGNVREQVADHWHDSYRDAPIDGTAWLGEGDAIRVQRGGSWGSTAIKLRSATRDWINEKSRFDFTGFRIARTLSDAEIARVLPSETEKRLALSRSQRREVQFALQELGHDPRGLDGIFGPRSRGAIRAWQDASGSYATGYITEGQLNALLDTLGPKLEKFRKRSWPGDIFRDCDECPEMVGRPGWALSDGQARGGR